MVPRKANIIVPPMAKAKFCHRTTVGVEDCGPNGPAPGGGAVDPHEKIDKKIKMASRAWPRTLWLNDHLRRALRSGIGKTYDGHSAT